MKDGVGRATCPATARARHRRLVGVAVLAGLASAHAWAPPTRAGTGFESIHRELGELLNRVENAADALRSEYRQSLRKSGRWLARGAELEAWLQVDELESQLDSLENAFGRGLGSGDPLEVERLGREALAQAERVELALARVRTSRSVRARWRDLAELLHELRLEIGFLARRNRIFEPPPGTRPSDPRERTPEVAFGPEELELVRASIYEVEDLANRLKARVRPDLPRRRDPPDGALARAEEADVQEAVMSLERDSDTLLSAWVRRGPQAIRPELEALLRSGRAVSEVADLEATGPLFREEWRAAAARLDALAAAYRLAGLAPRVTAPGR